MSGSTGSIVGLLLFAASSACADREPEPSSAAADTLELVGPQTISRSDREETFPAEDPRTGDLWFSTYEDSFDGQTLWVARKSATGWEPAVPAAFSGRWGDRAARFSPDGSHLYFTSNRPRSGTEPGDMNIWRVERRASGWSEPTLAAGPVNSPEADIHASITNDAIWIASNRSGTMGRSDIFRVAADGSVQHLPAPINDERSQPDVLVSPDETWMILVVTDHPDGLGGDDLFLSEFVDGSWTEPKNLGAPINSDAYEYGPTISADGRHLLFTSHRGDDANVYRIPLSLVRRTDR